MDIKQSLNLTNSWWVDGKVSKKFLLEREREEFKYIINKIYEKRILSIVGPRRVGKSTLIYQTINHLLEKEKVDKKRILFFSGDDPSLFFNDSDNLSNVLEIYFSDILQEGIDKLSSRVYIFIDEIHFIKNWQNYLKVYFDRKYDIKFVVTGSSSIHLFKDSSESLLGRIENIYVLPLTFNQFFNFYRTYIEEKEDIKFLKFNLDSPDESFRKLEDAYSKIDLRIMLKKVLDKYILVGGYPEYFENMDINIWQKRLADDIITRGIYKDILTLYNIKSPEILEKLMFYIADNDSQTFSYNNMSKDFGIDTVTIISYIGYLKQAFLINVLENYSTNIGKIIRSNKKLSILDNGICNSLLKKKELESNDVGHLIESMVDFDIRLLCERENYNEYYYRNSDKEEIDVIIDRKIDIIPIEVKYTNKIEGSDIKNIEKFIKKNKDNKLGKTKFGIIITKDICKKEGDLYYIPYYLFIL